jgi:hypothetical protein
MSLRGGRACGKGSLTAAIALAAAQLATIALAPRLTTADDNAEDLIDYSFSTWLGTGVYNVSGRSLTILTMPFAVRIRRPQNNPVGIKLLLPVTLGTHDFSNLRSVETTTFVPGVEVQLSILEQWKLKPFGQVGFGKDFSGGELAFILGGGVKSLVEIPWRDFTFGLGNKLLLAGTKTAGGNNTRGFSRFDSGLNIHHPLGFEVFRRRATFSVFYIYSNYINDVSLERVDREDITINRLHNIGFTIGAKPTLQFWRFRIPRFGVTYVTGDGLKAVRLNAGFPF